MPKLYIRKFNILFDKKQEKMNKTEVFKNFKKVQEN